MAHPLIKLMWSRVSAAASRSSTSAVAAGVRGRRGRLRCIVLAGAAGVSSSHWLPSRCSSCQQELRVVDDVCSTTGPEAPKKQTPTIRPVQVATSSANKKGSNISIEQEMLKSRRLFLTGEVNDESAKVIVQQLLYMEAEDPVTPVTLFINSGGGLVHSGLAILDVMSHVRMPVHTVAVGRCFSIAALLLSAGTPGHRCAYEHARVMIHEPSCSFPKLQATEMAIKIAELRNTKRVLEQVLGSKTGRSAADISAAIARDQYMSASEACEFGLIDRVVIRPFDTSGLVKARKAARDVPSPPESADGKHVESG